MGIDTPARIAVIGAGPIGIEAALYARFLGYEVVVLEQGSIGEHLRRWGHVRMFTPFRMNVSPLGLAALDAQDSELVLPDGQAQLTGQQFLDRYLWPLSKTDLLDGCIREQTRVLQVVRRHFLKTQAVADKSRAAQPFRLHLVGASGQAEWLEADAVIDATGCLSQPNPLGPDGLPAIGERDLDARIERCIPDLSGHDRDRFQHGHTLVIGDGYSAATTIVDLCQLAETSTDMQLTWITRRPGPQPIPAFENDELAERHELSAAANAICTSSPACLRHLAGVDVLQLERLEDGRIRVHLSGDGQSVIEVDRIIANVGYRPDRDLYRELQVHECYATEGPMALAATLMENQSGDCLQQQPHGRKSLLTTEENFFILGSKSYGRRSDFLLAAGLRQIQLAFSLIAGRKSLDLYKNLSSTTS